MTDTSTVESLVDVESGMPDQIVDGLHRRGHTVRLQAQRMAGWGPVSLITVEGTGLRTGAADPRVNTAAAAAR